MKLYFFGTPEFAVPTLKVLANISEFEIQAVVTQPDRPGNRKELTPPPVKLAAKALDLEVLQPAKIDKTLIERIKKDAPDIIIVVAYGGLIPKDLLEIPQYGCLNVHPSLLPKYRGASPIQEALLNGDEETGIAFMKLDEELDHGDIYLIKRLPIDQKDNFETLSEKLSATAAALLPFVIKDIVQGTLKPIPQPHAKATFCRKIEKEEGLIDPNKKTAKEILNQIRALNPWPGTYLKVKGKTLKILEATMSEAKPESPGAFEILSKKSFAIHTKEGSVLPTKVQLEGKQPMQVADFLNGYRNLLQ